MKIHLYFLLFSHGLFKWLFFYFLIHLYFSLNSFFLFLYFLNLVLPQRGIKLVRWGTNLIYPQTSICVYQIQLYMHVRKATLQLFLSIFKLFYNCLASMRFAQKVTINKQSAWSNLYIYLWYIDRLDQFIQQRRSLQEPISN